MVALSYSHSIKIPGWLNEQYVESSPIFNSRNEPNIKWHFEIYPNGTSKKSKGFLGIFLHCKNNFKLDDDPNIVAYFKFDVFVNGVKLASVQSNKPKLFSYVKPYWGFKKIMPRTTAGSFDLKVVCSLMFETKRNSVGNIDR